MIFKYIKHAFLLITKNKIDSIINITGLTVGITAFILLINYVNFEYSFDKSIPNHSNIYRIVTDVPQQSGNVMNTAMSSGYFTNEAQNHFGEILASTKTSKSFETLIKANEKASFESNLLFADSSFFKVFQFELVKGNPNYALNGSFNIVISESMANKYFGKTNPINQTLRVENLWDYTITGVMKDLPSNMHFNADFIATPDSIPAFSRNFWGALGLFNYVLLQNGTNPDSLATDFHQFSIDKMGENWANTLQFKLQAIDDIHLKSDKMHEVAKTSDQKQLYYLIGIAILIIGMAAVNFINIYSSRAEYRSKEVGLKKVIGASKKQLIFQFLTESILYTIISILLSIILIYILWSRFESFIGTSIPFDLKSLMLIAFGILITTGILAGLYPAIYLSSFSPIYAIKSMFRIKRSKQVLRKVLVITQFTLAIFMIIATLVVITQMQYIRNKNLGFDHNEILTVRLRSENLRTSSIEIKEAFNSISGVQNICFSSARIDNILAGQRPYIVQDSITPENSMDYLIRTIWIDDNFITLYNIKLLDGRNFSKDYSTDSDFAVILNEAAVSQLGLRDPIGTSLVSHRQDSNYVYNIVGVMKDFNYQSLHSPIEPLIFRYATENFSIMSVKTNKDNFWPVIQKAQNILNEFSPEMPISTDILSDNILEHYNKEKRISTLYQILTFLSIFIASLGLFGIVSFILEKKTKSIGIRKVLGASNKILLALFSKDILVWLFIATLIAFPLSYYIMQKWLQSFAFRTDIHWWIFPLSFVILFLISIITISYKTYKTISANPTESLRYE